MPYSLLRRKSLFTTTLVVLFFILVSFVCIYYGSKVMAEAVSWTGSMPTVVSSTGVPMNESWHDECKARNQIRSEVYIVSDDATAKTECLLGAYAGVNVYTHASQQAIAVQFPGDQHAYRTTLSCNSCVYLAERDTFVTVESSNAVRTGVVTFYENFLSRFQLVNSPVISEKHYSFNTQNAKRVGDFSGQEGYIGYAKYMQKSENDRWLAIDFNGNGLFRLDTQTMQLYKFADWSYRNWNGTPKIEFSITDDGQHIAVFGKDSLNTIFDVTPNCGRVIPDERNEDTLAAELAVPCPKFELHNPLGNPSNTYIQNFKDAFLPRFTIDGGEISFYVTSHDATQHPKRVHLQAANYTPRHIDYLALGDSFSSGEGDTEKVSSSNQKYYRAYTDTTGGAAAPRERCHVSTRSYPYKLAQGMGLNLAESQAIAQSSWQSVACSGAIVWDMKEQGSRDYLGQWDRLKGFDVGTLKFQALNEFIPGRQKQVEFVKKYKPNVITLTMGGNDIGFADKLASCAMFPTTCDIVNMKRNDLASKIFKQYKNLKELYEELYRASGSKAKIYVFGYPNFINGGHNANCALNVGFLNNEERELIVNSVTYLNNVIKQAAKATGVKYINIEDSLDGHRLCDEGEKYITGISDPADLSSNRQESFHPNAKGHQKIALRVWDNVWNEELGAGESLLDYDICPNSDDNLCPDISATKESVVVPEYFAGLDSSKNIEYKRVTSPDQKKDSLIEIVFGKFNFLPGTDVRVAMHSEPVDLGQHGVASDGSVTINVMTPSSVSAGYHTIIITGQSYSGEFIEYEQVVLVNGPDENDTDEDGIADHQDACLFVQASREDYDQDGIDDACDPIIGGSPANPSPTPTPSPSPKPSSGPILSTIDSILQVLARIIGFVVSFLQQLFSLKFK